MKYHVTYRIDFHPEGLAKEQVPDGHGAADSALIASIVYGPDGSSHLALMSVDGRRPEHEPLDDIELFKIWSLMARELALSEGLSAGWRDLCGQVFGLVQQYILKSRGDIPQCSKCGIFNPLLIDGVCQACAPEPQ